MNMVPTRPVPGSASRIKASIRRSLETKGLCCMSRLATFRQRRAREERSLRLVPSFALAARSAETVRSFKPRPFVFRRAVDDESLRILLVDRQVWTRRDCFVLARPRRCTVMLGYFPRALLLASII